MEIWSEGSYQAYLEANEAKFKEAAEKLGGRITL
jgi:DNA-binding transcriptional regulator/RsmH inhibitor MraZ